MSNSRPSSSRIMLEQEHLEALLDNTGVDHRAPDTQLSTLITSLVILATDDRPNNDSSVKVTDQSLFQKTVSEAIQAKVNYISFLVNTQTRADSEAAHWITITFLLNENTHRIGECVIRDSVEHKDDNTLQFYARKIHGALQQAGLAQDDITYSVRTDRLQVDEISCGYIAFLNFIANTPNTKFQSSNNKISHKQIQAIYTSNANDHETITRLNKICAPTINKIQQDITRRKKEYSLQMQNRASKTAPKTTVAPKVSTATTTVLPARTTHANTATSLLTPAQPITTYGSTTPSATPAASTTDAATATPSATPAASTTVAATATPSTTSAQPTTGAATATPSTTSAQPTTGAATATSATSATSTTVAATATPSTTPVIANPLSITEATANVAQLKVIAATKATEAHKAYLNAEAERQATSPKNREAYEANGNTWHPLSEEDPIPSQTALEAEEEAAAERAEEAYQAARKAEDDLKTLVETRHSEMKARIKQWAAKNVNAFMNSSDSFFTKDDAIYDVKVFIEQDTRNINRLINHYQNELHFIENSNRSITEVKNQVEAIQTHVALLEKLLYEYKYYIKSLLTNDKRKTLLSESKEKHFQKYAKDINQTLEKIKAFNQQTTPDAEFFNNEHPDLAYSTKSEVVLDTKPHDHLEDEIAHAIGRAFGNIDSDNIPGLESGVSPTSGRFTNKSNKVTVFKISIEDKRSKSKFVTATVRETGNDLSFVKSTFHAPDEKRSFFTKPWFKDTSLSMIEIAAQNIKNHRVALNDKLAQEPMKLILGNPKMPDAMAKAYIIYCKFAGITLDVPREYQSYQHNILQKEPSPKLVSYWNKHHPEDLSAHEVKFLKRDLSNRHALNENGEPVAQPKKSS